MSSSAAVDRALRADLNEVGSRLIAIPEDQWFERKSARVAARDLANALVGFANADGGVLVVGLSEGRVENTRSDTARRNAQMQASVDFTSPPVRAHSSLRLCIDPNDGEEKELLIFDVEPGEVVHTNQRDEAFLRVGDENRRLSFVQRQELVFDRGQGTYEARPIEGADLSVVDEDLADGYASALGHPDRDRLLEARGLASEGSLTVAGCVLFARQPERFLPEAFIRVLRYRGTKRGAGARQQLLRDERLEGPLPHQLFNARDVVEDLVPTRHAMLENGRFGDIPLVPRDAWLEAIVNAAVHRSYSLGGDHIRVEVFDDRIEVSSPGRFPGLVDLSDPPNATRFARNPRIARVCSDLQFGQELGEGIRRMYEEMREAGLEDPVYRQSQASVHLTLSAEPAERDLEARLPVEARQIRAALREAGRLSTGEVGELLGLSRPATIKRLRAMQEAAVIDWVGKAPNDPRAYWTLPRAS